MRLSARNVLHATVKTVTPGAVDTEVVVDANRQLGQTVRGRCGATGVESRAHKTTDHASWLQRSSYAGAVPPGTA
jgi:hypothetical protein